MAMNKKTRAASESIGFLVAIGAILIVLNVLAANFPIARFDLTRSKAYSLSDGSERTARSLRDRMEITAYVSELPAPYNALERSLRDVLAEYQAASNGKIRVRFVNPDTDEKRTQAEQAGVQKVGQQMIEHDSVSVKEGYRGLAITYLGETQAIPVIQGTDGLEYQITMLMKRMLGEKVKIGILKTAGGPSLAQGLGSFRRATPTYDLVEVDAHQPIDESLRALLVIAPEAPISEDELRNIDAFVMKGHSLGVFGGGIKAALEQAPSAQPVDSGLNRLLERWGLHLESNVVLDARCTRIPRPGPMGMQVGVPYPPIPIVVFDADEMKHAATYNIPNATFPFTSSIRVSQAPAGARVTVLARSSEQAWVETGSTINLDVQPWRPGPMQQFPLLASVEGKLPSAFAANATTSGGGAGPAGPAQSASDVRVLVFGTGLFFRDEFLPPADRASPEQIAQILALPLNSIDWLANDSDLIAVRGKTVEDPQLDIPSAITLAETAALSANENQDAAGVERALAQRTAAIEAWDRRKNAVKLANMLGIPLLIVAFGLFRWRSRQRKKESLAA